MKRLYTVPLPPSMSGNLMLSNDHYVPATAEGVKLAAWLEDSTAEQREELFKIAAEKDTRDLAKAYNAMCNAGEKPAEKSATDDDDEEDDDDYGQGSFYEDDDDDDDDDED